MTVPDYHETLRAELVAAAERATSRPRHRRRVAVAVALVAAAATIVVGVSLSLDRPRLADAGVQVFRTPDDVTIQLDGEATTPEEIEEAARDAGFDIDVVEAATGPSRVGDFIGFSAGELPTGYGPVGDQIVGFTAVRLPHGWPGNIVLTLGRAAKKGEPYAGVVDALAPGERLACAPVLGLTRAEAERVLAEDPRAAGLRLVWSPLSDPPAASDVVAAVNASSATDVLIDLRPPTSTSTRSTPTRC